MSEAPVQPERPSHVVDAVREKGLRNVTLLTVAPTGCVAPDTLISTATGLKSTPETRSW